MANIASLEKRKAEILEKQEKHRIKQEDLKHQRNLLERKIKAELEKETTNRKIFWGDSVLYHLENSVGVNMDKVYELEKKDVQKIVERIFDKKQIVSEFKQAIHGYQKTLTTENKDLSGESNKEADNKSKENTNHSASNSNTKIVDAQ